MDNQAVVDLAIVVDATGSMGTFLSSLSESLQQIVQIIDITNVIQNINIIMYRDYCDSVITASSGWVSKIDDLIPFIRGLRASGGGDTPEAGKTAANNLLDVVKNNTIVIWYADAPPHHKSNARDNFAREINTLIGSDKIFDWIELCDTLAARNIIVYPIINRHHFDTSSFYVAMSTITGGKTLYLESTNEKIITQTTIKLLLSLMGCDNEFKSGVKELVYKSEFNRSSILDENNNAGYLPGTRSSILVNTVDLQVQTHPWLVTNLRSLVSLFNADSHYKDKIFAVFKSLMKPTSVLSLTYNTIFATFWRLICRTYDDPRKEVLKEQMSVVLENLKKTNREDHAVVTEWISDSYNQTYEVNDIIKTKAVSKVPALVLDTTRFYLPQEILELSRTCNAKVLSTVVDMLSSIRLIEKEEDLPKTNEQELDSKGRPIPLKYIPLSLPNKYLFSILPHLIAPGSNFSLRPSMILATVAYITNNQILKDRAKNHLEYHKGKWIDQSLPENYTGGFINLMLRVPEFLIDEEISFFKFYQKVFGLLINGSTELDIDMPFTPYKKVCNDFKRECDHCHHIRSFTLLTIDDDGKYKCGLCHSPADDDTDTLNRVYTIISCDTPGETGMTISKDTTLGPSSKEHQDDYHSVYLECKSCLCHYALVNVDKMNVTPKCYGCRFDVYLPNVKCIICTNKYVDPAKIYSDNSETFVCPQCVSDPRSSIDILKVKFKDIYLQNKSTIHSLVGFEMPSDINVFGGHSIFSIKDKINILDHTENPTSLVFNRKFMLNAPIVIIEMLKWINSGSAEKGLCMICFNEFSKSNLRQICGRKVCQSVACYDCMKSWYGENKVGDLIHVNALTCPFCKQCPMFNILAAFNRQVCAMVRTNNSFDIDWWYGWCLKCFQPKKVVEKECSEDAPQLGGKFICEECSNVKPENSKECPNSLCKIPIIKDGGCNHMECTACKKHFCWLCANVSYETSEETYDHLYKIHGGAFEYDQDD